MKTNRTPFTDVCELISSAPAKDSEGYNTSLPAPTSREVFCSFSEGVNRAEYYEAMKAGVKLSATVEIWEDDFAGERELLHGTVKYKIGRTWPTGNGTIFLYLEEVVH